MEFKTAYKRGETIENPLGSELAPIYEYRIDKETGRKILTKCGETNIYEMIQASHEATKIENIVKRATQGDQTVLNAMNGHYIDISELPTNMIELQNIIMKAKGEFNKLDAETRALFDNSAERYVSEYGSNEWAEKLGLIEKEEQPKKKTSKKKEENILKEEVEDDE